MLLVVLVSCVVVGAEWIAAPVGVTALSPEPPPSPTIIPKTYPSDTDRSFMCPSRVGRMPPGYFPSIDDLNNVFVNHSLDAVVPAVANFSDLALILIKRHASGAPWFKYYGRHEDFAVETWSSSKIFSAMKMPSAWCLRLRWRKSAR